MCLDELILENLTLSLVSDLHQLIKLLSSEALNYSFWLDSNFMSELQNTGAPCRSWPLYLSLVLAPPY